MNDSVTALNNKHFIYPSSSWMYKLSVAITERINEYTGRVNNRESY